MSDRFTARLYEPTQAHGAMRQARQWHIEAWGMRVTSNALILRWPDGRRYSFNDSVGVVGG